MLGEKFDKPLVVLGEHKNYTLLQEQEEIADLAWQQSLPPLKILFVPDGRLFALNTHRAVAYLMRFGKHATLGEIPFVLFDFSSLENPVVVDVNGSTKQKKLQGVFDSASRLANRVQNGWRPKNVSYTIGDLQKQLFDVASKEIIFE